MAFRSWLRKLGSRIKRSYEASGKSLSPSPAGIADRRWYEKELQWEEYHQLMQQEQARIQRRIDWIDAHAWRIAGCLFVLGVVGGGCASAVKGADPTCPDGRQWTTWCECEPPLYGDDC